MARQQGSDFQNMFRRGLITEVTELNFPKDACVDSQNVVFDERGEVKRSPGFDLESEELGLPVTNDYPNDNYRKTHAFVEYEWTDVENTNKRFIVQQVGQSLYFFDVTDSSEVRTNYHSAISLLTYKRTAVTNTEFAMEPCSFAQGRGKLYIANKNTNPLRVSYNEALDEFKVNSITLFVRDTVGLDDGLDLTTRPTADRTSLAANNPAHYYNIWNQGWHKTDTLAQWDAALTTMPSNADTPSYYRVDDTDPFGSNRVDANDPGNTPAPKGHFIYEVGRYDPQTAIEEEQTAYTFGTIFVEGSLVDTADFTVFNIGTTRPNNAFDGVKGQTQSNSTLFTSSTGAQAVGSAWSVAPDNLIGARISFPSDYSGGASGTRVAEIYGKNSLPTTSTDGTLLATSSSFQYFNIRNTSINVLFNGVSTGYTHYWVRLRNVSGTFPTEGQGISEIEWFNNTVSEFDSITFPTHLEFVNGRLFYAGFDSQRWSDRVLFSKVIERDGDEGLCYQQNDPTSDFVTDIVDSDGGVIDLGNLGNITDMIFYQQRLIIITDTGVWAVGGVEGVFSATSIAINAVSSTGSSSNLSVVNVRGLPMWWAEDGIYTIDYDARYNSITLRSLTEETIKQTILNIPLLNRSYVKGAYDRLNNIVYWLYNDTPSLSSDDYYTYNKILCLNLESGAFYIETISNPTIADFSVCGIIGLSSGVNYTFNVDPIKFTCIYEGDFSATSGVDYMIHYAERKNDTFSDWKTFNTTYAMEDWTTSTLTFEDRTDGYIDFGSSVGAGTKTISKTFTVSTSVGARAIRAKVKKRGTHDILNLTIAGNSSGSVSVNFGLDTVTKGSTIVAPFTLTSSSITDKGSYLEIEVIYSDTTNTQHTISFTTTDVINTPASAGGAANGFSIGDFTFWAVADGIYDPIEAHGRMYKLSYFLTGEHIDGEIIKDARTNFVYMVARRAVDTSFFVQGRYGFTDSVSSVRWSSPQQGYKNRTTFNQEHEAVRIRRLMIRGGGRAIALYVYSEDDYPFTILGWSRYVSANSHI